jgi:hypothetical protein
MSELIASNLPIVLGVGAVTCPTSTRKRAVYHRSLSQLRVAVVRSEKLVSEDVNSSGTQRKENVRRWKPIPSNGK